MDKKKMLRTYLLFAGATIPAFTSITIYSAHRKFYAWDKKQIILFAGVTVVSSALLIYLANKKKML